jgi:2-dehydropantoate 2-reductase
MAGRFLIWGSGAIGGTAGAHLKRAGHNVTFVDVVPEHVAAISGPGLKITGPVSDFTVAAPAFTPETLTGTWDHILLAVKAQFTEQAAQALRPHLSPDGYVVSLQNGLCEATIASVVGTERVIGAFINYGADWIAPGEILYGNRGAFVLGELDGRITPRLRALHATIQSGFEPDAIMTDSVQSYLWGKLGYLTLLYAQALGQLGIADCLERPELLPLWRAICGEAHAVATAIGAGQRPFNGFDPEAFAPGATEEQAKKSVADMVAFNRPNAKTHSGIWRDLAVRKRRTEVEMQIVPIATIGAEYGIDCVKCRKLAAMIHEIEDGKRPLHDDNLLELLAA